jgi:hypothetical protein
MSEPIYYYEKEGATAGPIPAAELVAQGVRRETLVWAANMKEWQPAGQVDALTSLFASVPPPLPIRTGPPPLPGPPPLLGALPVNPAPQMAPATAVLTSPILFASMGYSLPLLGKFKNDREVWAMETQERFGEFLPNADLKSLHEWGFQPLKKYQFVLLDADGQPLLTLYKPSSSLLNPFQIGELRVLDAQNQLLGTCRHRLFKGLTRLLTIEDAQGREMMALKQVSISNRDWVFETPTGVIIGRVRRSQSANWMHLLFEHKNDRFELIFEETAKERHKVLGVSAVVAAYLLAPS